VKRLRAIAAVATMLMLAGCSQAALSDDVAGVLGQRMAALREAVNDGDRGRAEAELDGLRTEARDRGGQGEITATRLGRILAAADDVERFLAELPPPPEPEPEPAPQPPAATPQPAPETEDDRGRGRGRGRGGDDDNGNGNGGNGGNGGNDGNG
jgi:uncharacterized membrane protein YgcG